MSTEISEKRDIVSNQEDKISGKQEKVEKQTVSEDKKTVIFITEYDTDKPVNPETGKHPVKSETIKEITKNSTGETVSTENITKYEENITNSIDNSTVEAKSNKIEKIKQESPKDPYRYRYLLGIVVIIVGLVIYLNRNKILSFINRLL